MTLFKSFLRSSADSALSYTMPMGPGGFDPALYASAGSVGDPMDLYGAPQYVAQHPLLACPPGVALAHTRPCACKVPRFLGKSLHARRRPCAQASAAHPRERSPYACVLVLTWQAHRPPIGLGGSSAAQRDCIATAAASITWRSFTCSSNSGTFPVIVPTFPGC